MTHQLTHGLININGRVIESYTRKSFASPELRQYLGLPTTGDLNSNINIQPIPEFLVLQGQNLAKNVYSSFSLARIGQPVIVHSVFIDAPGIDDFVFEVMQQDTLIFTFRLRRNDTPYQFPVNPIPPENCIKIKPLDDITLLRIILSPCVILETYDTDENIGYNSST